jgi:2'-5' RNA ligase superfamily
MAQSALIVAVPEAESVVGGLRSRLDPAALQGVPPHITTLFPFVEPDQIDETTINTLRAAIHDVPAFEFRLPRVARFPETLYLAPEPAAPFVTLTLTVARAFPDYPPYGGQFSTVIPHLTVAHGPEQTLEAAHLELSDSLSRRPEIRPRCTELSLIVNSSGRWAELARIPLRPS